MTAAQTTSRTWSAKLHNATNAKLAITKLPPNTALACWSISSRCWASSELRSVTRVDVFMSLRNTNRGEPPEGPSKRDKQQCPQDRPHRARGRPPDGARGHAHAP